MESFLVGWLISNVLNAGVRLSAEFLEGKIQELRDNPARFGWEGEISDRDDRIIQCIRFTYPYWWRRYALSGNYFRPPY